MGRNHSPTYWSWNAMVRRCTDRGFWKFPTYGGKGIRVCRRWLSYKNFVADMGERPKGKTLDRVDNLGSYTKQNCRWADRKTQARNSGIATQAEAFGERKSFVEWTEDPRCKVGYRTLVARVTRGEPPEQAITTPPRMRFAALCRRLGVNYSLVRARILRGWPESLALSTPKITNRKGYRREW
jgi:hypothetical protein